VLTLSLAAATAVLAQPTAGACSQNGAETRCSLDLRAHFDAQMLERLRSGFANRMLYRIYIRRADNDDAITLAALRLVEVYELWDEEYYVYQNDQTGDRVTSKSVTRVVELLAIFDDMTVATDLPPGTYYADVIVEVNPLGEADEAAIRSWISRSRGRERRFTTGGRSLFGTFVSLFINIRPGAAERTLRVRTEPFTVGGP
jgi:hypothetical protein